MKRIINLYKPVGLTPLQAIIKFKEKDLTYSGKKMGYAGRLDPMAEGVLLCLVGDEGKKIGQYLGFDKEYRAEILLGLKSDSNDVLGLLKKGELVNNHETKNSINTSQNLESEKPNNKSYNLLDNYKSENINNLQDKDKVELFSEKEIPIILSDNNLIQNKTSFNKDINNQEFIKELKKKIKNLKGKYKQKIPAFSSYRIKGKPMFYYAREGEEVEEVNKNVFIKSIKINSIYEISSTKLLKYILRKIDKVKGDFRQNQIKNNWKEVLENSNKRFIVVDITISCSSGTYIRAIAEDIGKDYGGGLLLSLKRTKVGKFDVRDSIRI